MTDNAANMKKAFRLPGYEVDPLEEEQDENGDDLTEDEEWMSELESQIPKRGSCGAHTLQLVVKDGLQVRTGFDSTSCLHVVCRKPTNNKFASLHY